jgi:hypothetical protein
MKRGRVQHVDLILTPSSDHDFSSGHILYKKKMWVKLKENMIIYGKLSN